MRQDYVPRNTALFTVATASKLMETTGYKIDFVHRDHKLYGGTNLGLLNFLFKLAAGERLGEIVAQSRSAGRWQEFSSELYGKKSDWMLRVDKADIAIAPRIDPILDRLRPAFIMIVRAKRRL